MMKILIFVAVALSLPALVRGLLQLVALQSSVHEGVRRRLAQFKLWQLGKSPIIREYFPGIPLVLSLGAMVSQWTTESLAEALERCRVRDVLAWCREMLGESVQSQRERAYGQLASATKPGGTLGWGKGNFAAAQSEAPAEPHSSFRSRFQ